MTKKIRKVWKDIEINNTFIDGSKVIKIHEKYKSECYMVSYNHLFKRHNCTLSDSHLLLCNISKVEPYLKTWIEKEFGGYRIPTLYDKHIYVDENQKQFEKYEVIESDISKVSDKEYWLPISSIFLLVRELKQKILCNGKKLYIEYSGVKEVFCVETSTHKFETCGLIHHNSVTLRNIIFHCLTHGEQIAVALVDLKFTEFTPFKGPLDINTNLMVKRNNKIIKTTMEKLNSTDMVKNYYGQWKNINLLPIIEYDKTYELETTYGNIKCSCDHLWTIFDKKEIIESTNNLYKFIGKNIGKKDGPILLNVVCINRKSFFRCINIKDPKNETNERLFEILTDKNQTILTHNCKNVVAVANTVKETVEVLRIARECMYKRNQELAKLGLNDIKDFKPQKLTDEVIITGRKFKDSDTLEIKVNGEIKTVTVKDLESYL